jgi:SPP1 gp7 family putative phage head morphogenesis protein
MRLAQGMRLMISTSVDATTQDLVRAWARAWNEVAADWEAAIAVLVEESAGDLWPSRWQIRRAVQVQAALQVTREALDALAVESGVRILTPVPAMVGDTADWVLRLLDSQHPAGVVVGFNRVDARALEWIVARTTQQVTSLTKPLAPDAYAAVLAEITRGVAVGENPRAAARQMLRRTETTFNGGLTRALRIARTEILDAHRAAAAATEAANTDVVTGWRWQAALSPRTCLACLAMNGTLFPVEEPGPQGHRNCRCTRVAVLKSWEELGFALEEPVDDFPDARTWFDRQTLAVQRAIMGPSRLQLLQDGAIGWDDLTVIHHNPGWRPAYQARPVSDLLHRTGSRQSA